jgi:hypothetical protein
MLTLRLVSTSLSYTMLQGHKRYTISICSNDIRCFQGLANGYTMYECLFEYLSRLRTFCLTSPFFLRTAPYKHHMHNTIEKIWAKEWGSESGWSRLGNTQADTDTCSSVRVEVSAYSCALFRESDKKPYSISLVCLYCDRRGMRECGYETVVQR